MLIQAFPAAVATSLAFGGVVISNHLYDHGVDAALSRSLAAFVGGLALLVTVLWMSAWPAVALAAAMTILIVGLRFTYRQGLRGSTGRRPGQEWAHVTFGATAVASLAIGWGILGDRWLAFLPIAFVAWGDGSAGLLRATVWRGRIRSLWPSAIMLAVCLAVAASFSPFWIGAVGAMVATVAERHRPDVAALWDDNVNVVAASIGVMALLAGVVT